MRGRWLVLASLLPVLAAAQEITQVMVVNQKTYTVVTTLSDAGVLAIFANHWKAKAPTDAHPEPQWIYKIDIETDQNSDRWLYDPRGWTQLRSKTKTLVYKLSAPADFNKILGIRRTE